MGRHHDVLGVASTATPDEIKKRFRKLALEYHPDRHVKSSEAEKRMAGAKFKTITEAYDALTNPNTQHRHRASHSTSHSHSHSHTHSQYTHTDWEAFKSSRRGGNDSREWWKRDRYEWQNDWQDKSGDAYKSSRQAHWGGGGYQAYHDPKVEFLVKIHRHRQILGFVFMCGVTAAVTYYSTHSLPPNFQTPLPQSSSARFYYDRNKKTFSPIEGCGQRPPGGFQDQPNPSRPILPKSSIILSPPSAASQQSTYEEPPPSPNHAPPTFMGIAAQLQHLIHAPNAKCSDEEQENEARTHDEMWAMLMTGSMDTSVRRRDREFKPRERKPVTYTPVSVSDNNDLHLLAMGINNIDAEKKRKLGG